jgi:hypothetical protein
MHAMALAVISGTALAVMSCGERDPEAARESPAASVAEQPVFVEGEAYHKSLPFRLAGGNYRLDWEAVPMLRGGSGGCFIGTRIISTDGKFREEAVSAMAEGDKDTGSSALYNVPAGTYYLDSSSGCKWRIAFRPL